MDTLIGDAELAALAGLAGGVVLGLAARLGRFCTLGAIEDVLYGQSDHRLRMWGVATGVALIAAFAMQAGGIVEARSTPYLDAGWNPLAHIAGGLVFGYGMALAGNCGFGALARLGGGDLRSFLIVLVMGIAGYVTMSGPLAALRVTVFPPDLLTGATAPGYAHWIGALTGLSPVLFGIGAGLAVLALALGSAAFRAERAMVVWGVLVGAVIAYAWLATTLLAQRSFGGTPIEGYSFVAPLGETILYAMTASGTPVSFAVGAVSGVWLGAFLGALRRGLFRWEACDDARELRRQIFGAALMGAGAVVAAGCSIGQGMTAMSVLAFGAPLTLASIFLGAALGLRHLIHGFAPA